jgi:hypothetical protein
MSAGYMKWVKTESNSGTYNMLRLVLENALNQMLSKTLSDSRVYRIDEFRKPDSLSPSDFSTTSWTLSLLKTLLVPNQIHTHKSHIDSIRFTRIEYLLVQSIRQIGLLAICPSSRTADSRIRYLWNTFCFRYCYRCDFRFVSYMTSVVSRFWWQLNWCLWIRAVWLSRNSNLCTFHQLFLWSTVRFKSEFGFLDFLISVKLPKLNQLTGSWLRFWSFFRNCDTLFLALLLHLTVLTTFKKPNRLVSVCNNHHFDAQLYYDISMLAYRPGIPEVMPGAVCDRHDGAGGIGQMSQSHLVIVGHHWNTY